VAQCTYFALFTRNVTGDSRVAFDLDIEFFKVLTITHDMGTVASVPEHHLENCNKEKAHKDGVTVTVKQAPRFGQIPN
jgi:hypothetical protein